MEEERIVTPGFRFYPTEEELITFYLKHKIHGMNMNTNMNMNTSNLLQHIERVIPHLRIYDLYPWDLPQHAGELCRGDPEQWFFFVPRQENEARGGRTSRLTNTGYWKATGSPSVVYSSGNRGIGIKRTLVFYSGRAPKGKKTKWKMIEYKAFQEENSSSNTNRKPKLIQELSLCRIYIKSSCLRAFDRRPSGGVAIHDQPQRVLQTLYNDEHCATTSTQFNRTTVVERAMLTTSHDDHSRNSSETIESCFTMETDDYDFWG